MVNAYRTGLKNLLESIGNLKSLRELDVFNNQLTSKTQKILDELQQIEF